MFGLRDVSGVFVPGSAGVMLLGTAGGDRRYKKGVFDIGSDGGIQS